MGSYSVFLSGREQKVEAEPNDTLSKLRQKLREADNHNFVYFDPISDEKLILNKRDIESKRTISAFTFEGNILIMTVVNGEKTDLFGSKRDWLYDRHLQIQIILNKTDQVGRQTNAGKFDPIMLVDVQPSNSSSNFFAERAVICEKGSLVEFNIGSWGAAGYGLKISSEKDVICDDLYITYGNDYNRRGYSGLRRYVNSNNTIRIESTQSLNIPTQDTVYYQKITVKTWRVTSYKKDGNTYTSNTEAPYIESPTKSDSRFEERPPGGDFYVPGQDIQSGAPERGPTSDQRFGSISNLVQDARDKVLGAVIFHFFVFKDREAANRVIKVLNSSNPSAIG